MKENKNYIKQVANILGVEIGEEFDIEGIRDNPHKFIENNLLNCNGFGCCERIGLLIIGNSRIIKKPFVPKKGETYHIILENGFCRGVTNNCRYDDFALIAFGNCFRTKESATRNTPAILKKMDEYKK